MNTERRSIFALPAGRRSKWAVFAVWILAWLVIFGADLPGKFADAENNESTSFLPGDAESTKALQAAEELQGGELAPAVIVYRREAGLTPGDREKIVQDVERLTERRLPGVVADDANHLFDQVFFDPNIAGQQIRHKQRRKRWLGVEHLEHRGLRNPHQSAVGERRGRRHAPRGARPGGPGRVGRARQEHLRARPAAGSRVRSRDEELTLLREVGQAMRDASICGLGQTASSAIESALRQPDLGAL